MARGDVDLTVIIPAYNEVGRLEKSLLLLSDYLRAHFDASEILVVDDGSRDGTFEMVQAVSEKLAVPVRGLRYAENRGKGFALKAGFAHADGELLLFTDADLSTPVEETARLVAALRDGADVAIGSRKMDGAHIQIHQPWLREKLGGVFTLLVRATLTNVSDVTCGFKAFRAQAGKDLFSRLRLPDWSFDAELLYLVRRLGYRLAEVPVRWEDRTGTKVSLLRDALRSLWGLVQIRARAATGAYERPEPLPPGIESWRSARPEGGAERDPGRPRP